MALPGISVRVDAVGAEETARDLNAVGDAAVRNQTKINQANKAVVATGQAAQKANPNIRMMSMQLSQVAQQGAATGQWAQAFAIQAADIGLAFGTVGIAIGAAIPVITALSSGFIDAHLNTKTLDDRLDALGETMGELQAPLSILEMSIDQLVDKYGNAAQAVREYAAAQAQLRAGQARQRLGGELEALTSTVGKYWELVEGGHAWRNTLLAISRDFGVTTDQARELEPYFQAIGEAEGLENQKAALEGMIAALDRMEIPLSSLPDEFSRAVSEVIELNIAVAETEALINRVESAAFGMSAGIGQALQGLSGQQLLAGFAPGQSEAATRSASAGAARSSARIDALVKSLMTEEEVLSDWYATSLEMLNNASSAELEALGGKHAAIERLEKEHQDRLNAIKEAGSVDALTTVLSSGQQIAAAIGQNNEKAAKIAQAFAATEAFVNTYRAAAQALADPQVPFWGKPAAVAAVVSNGIGLVNAIKSARSGGGAASTASAATANVNQAPQNVASISISGLNPSDMYSGRQVIDMVNGINEYVSPNSRLQLV